MPTTSFKNYVFTINNPGPTDVEHLTACVEATKRDGPPYCRYIIYQYERGDAGVRHVQGYVQFRDKIRVKAAAKRLGGRAHVEPRRGSHEEARSYCSKEETRTEGPYEAGTPVLGAGDRSDLVALQQDLQGGMSMAEVSDAHFGLFIRYPRSIQLYKQLHAKPRDPDVPTKCLIFWGDPGTGKTRRAYHDYPDAFWVPGGNKVWFDGYAGESSIVFDEFYGQMEYPLFLRLCDRYPIKLPVKGGFVECSATVLVFTSNKDPREWYVGADFGAILRRSSITRFTSLSSS